MFIDYFRSFRMRRIFGILRVEEEAQFVAIVFVLREILLMFFVFQWIRTCGADFITLYPRIGLGWWVRIRVVIFNPKKIRFCFFFFHIIIFLFFNI